MCGCVCGEFPEWCASGVPWRVTHFVSPVITLHYITLPSQYLSTTATQVGGAQVLQHCRSALPSARSEGCDSSSSR